MKLDAAEVKAAARIEDEKWIQVAGYEGLYSVSSNGRVRRDSPGRGTVAGNILRGFIGARGYPNVCLRGRVLDVHILVARAFLGERPAGMHVDHLNGNKADPRAENLEYVTPSENAMRAVRLGLRAHGEAHCFSKLKAKDVAMIRSLVSSGQSQRSTAKQFGVSHTTVKTIINGTAWRQAA